MDSRHARQLFAEHANAMAYVDVELPSGDRSIGSAFHVGDGVFVTARHVVEGNKIIEVRITDALGISSREFFRDVLKVNISNEYLEQYDSTIGSITKGPPLWRHYHPHLEVSDGPYLAADANLDVAVFRVRELHPAAGVIKLGWHWVALGVVTSSFLKSDAPEELGFFAVLSIEAIVRCLKEYSLYPETQRKHAA